MMRQTHDPTEERDLSGSAREKEMEEKLRAAIQEVDAPDDQLARMGLA